MPQIPENWDELSRPEQEAYLVRCREERSTARLAAQHRFERLDVGTRPLVFFQQKAYAGVPVIKELNAGSF